LLILKLPWQFWPPPSILGDCRELRARCGANETDRRCRGAAGWQLLVELSETATVLAAIAVIFDGFDIQILGFAIPSLIREWHVDRIEFGPVLAVGLAGMVVDGPLAGYCGDRFGRRTALIVCVAVFGVATMLTAFVHGFAGLILLRLATGMGTGGALPSVSALTAEFAPSAGVRRP
jgi:MFS family permease